MKPFSINEKNLNSHFEQVEKILSATSIETGVRLEKAETPDGVTIGMIDRSPCEAVRRNRGGESIVAPMLELGGGLTAWFGFRERWKVLARRGTALSYGFSSCDLTVHFGRKGIARKPQLFRAEWVGLVEGRGGWEFEAGDAAHPHWQFDALESFDKADEREFAQELREALRSDNTDSASDTIEVREFDFSGFGEENSLQEDDIELLVRHRKVSAIHFPSVAPWWLNDAEHAHRPLNADHVRLWLKRTLRYVRSELSRV